MQTRFNYVNSDGTTTRYTTPLKSKRTHAWHASYAVLALMTSLLALSGCNKEPAEQAGSEVDKAVQNMQESMPAPSAGIPESNPVEDSVNQAGPAQEAGQAIDEAREKAGQKIERMGEKLQQP